MAGRFLEKFSNVYLDSITLIEACKHNKGEFQVTRRNL